jgi:hypothetical protein
MGKTPEQLESEIYELSKLLEVLQNEQRYAEADLTNKKIKNLQFVLARTRRGGLQGGLIGFYADSRSKQKTSFRGFDYDWDTYLQDMSKEAQDRMWDLIVCLLYLNDNNI